MADVALQRKNMVESQVRPSDMTDRRVIRAMQEVPREAFVPEAQVAIVYGDLDVPLEPGRVLMAPRVFAKLVQMLTIEPEDDVLIVGSGMGYSAAIIARLAKSVTALESSAALAGLASKALAANGVSGIEFVSGPLTGGAPAKAPFDVIFVDGGAADVPAALIDQLTIGGRLGVVMMTAAGGKATLVQRHAGGVDHTDMFDATVPVLPGFAKAPAFNF